MGPALSYAAESGRTLGALAIPRRAMRLENSGPGKRSPHAHADTALLIRLSVLQPFRQSLGVLYFAYPVVGC